MINKLRIGTSKLFHFPIYLTDFYYSKGWKGGTISINDKETKLSFISCFAASSSLENELVLAGLMDSYRGSNENHYDFSLYMNEHILGNEYHRLKELFTFFDSLTHSAYFLKNGAGCTIKKGDTLNHTLSFDLEYHLYTSVIPEIRLLTKLNQFGGLSFASCRDDANW
jgi:hypothetical protein